MAAFKVKFSKDKSQRNITITRDDAVNLSAVSALTANVYTDDLGTADNTYVLDAGEIASLVAGSVTISVADLLDATADDFYTIILTGSGFTSDPAGVAITLEATGKTLSQQGFIDVYGSDFRVDSVLITAFMLLQEMNLIEEQDASLQKRADFTTRLDTLKKILNY